MVYQSILAYGILQDKRIMIDLGHYHILRYISSFMFLLFFLTYVVEEYVSFL